MLGRGLSNTVLYVPYAKGLAWVSRLAITRAAERQGLREAAAVVNCHIPIHTVARGTYVTDVTDMASASYAAECSVGGAQATHSTYSAAAQRGAAESPLWAMADPSKGTRTGPA